MNSLNQDQESEGKIPKVFISYSWTNEEHVQKVVELATRMMDNHVEVILDKWDLREGQDKYVFMEQTVSNPEIDKVLLICNKAYVKKADARTDGVGDETLIISSEIYGKEKQEKFIPIIFEYGDDGKPCLPTYIKSRIYIDMSDDERYEDGYVQLIRRIHDKPIYKKPPIGDMPAWLNDEDVELFSIRDLVKQIKGSQNNHVSKINILSQNFIAAFIKTTLEFTIRPNIVDYKSVMKKIEEMKPLRDVFTDFLECLLAKDVIVYDILTTFFEKFYNEVLIVEGSSYCDREHDHFKFLLWEMFICATAIFCNYERYEDIKQIVSHTYFLNDNPFNNADVNPRSFTAFRPYLKSLEEDYKANSEIDLLSFTADILVKREKYPILIKRNIVDADILLSQIGLIKDKEWFPLTYIYNRNSGLIWKKLVSKKHCEKTMVLYGANNIEDLKRIAKEYIAPNHFKYNRSFEHVPCIATKIDIEAIGTLP